METGFLEHLIISKDARTSVSYLNALISPNYSDDGLFLELDSTNMTTLVQEVVQKFTQYISCDEKIEIRIKFLSHDIQTVCDPSKIKQVVSTIIRSSIKNSINGTIIIDIKKDTMKTNRSGFCVYLPCVTVKVQSNKEILSAEHEIQKIFGSWVYKEVDDEDINQIAVCEKIISLHKGKIWAEASGNGSIALSFSIPQKYFS